MARFRPRGRVKPAASRARPRRGVSRRRVRQVGVVLGIALGVVSVSVGAYQFLTRPPGALTGRSGSVLLRGAPPVAIGHVPMSYRIVYRVETTSGQRTEVTAEVVEVARPFDSRTVSRRAKAAPTDEFSSQAATFGAFETRSGGKAKPLMIRTPPDLAVSDLRPDVDLPGLVTDGVAERREVRRVAGRVCQVFRFGEPIVSGGITPYVRGSKSFADECIDGAGLLLEDVWVRDGSRLRRKLATSAEEGKALPKGVPIDGPFLEPKQGGGALRPVDPASHSIGDTYELPAAPAGFAYKGRWAAVPPQPLDENDPNSRQKLIAGTVDVWVRGADVIILDQGGTLGGGTPFDEEPAAPEVDAGAAGRGRLLLDLRLNEVRVKLSGGHYVKLLATLPPTELRALAVTLTKLTGGTGLRYL